MHSLIFVLGLTLLTSCSNQPKLEKQKRHTKKSLTTKVGANQHYTSLAFDKGETRLTAVDKAHLETLAQKIRQSGKEVDDIKIITWADKEYTSGSEAPNAQIILARQRAESIKNYLEEDLMTDEDIDFYNMAQKPKPLGRFFKMKDDKLAETFRTHNDANMMSDSRASKALVIIEYEDGSRTSL